MMMDPRKPGIRLTCRQVHRLVSEGMDRNLSVVERLRLRLHLTVCDACTRFNRQMSLLRSAMKSFPLDLDAEPPANGDDHGQGDGHRH